MHQQEKIFLERIPDKVYEQMLDLFSEEYYFNNGTRMRIANYFVGISQDLANTFVQFITEITEDILASKYPSLTTPKGFEPSIENILPTEQIGNFSFASFDMAVGEECLQNIEFQAVSTYPVSAAKLNQILLNNLHQTDAYIFADSPATTWEDFISLYENIISGQETKGVVITDRLLKQQKTNFEFHATQKELRTPIELVDMKDIFEKEGTLFYASPQENTKPIKITRLYNRILLAEALFDDNYPHNKDQWNFRFDRSYNALKFINHPIKLYEVSKRLSPYIQHPFNPECFELAEAAQKFRNGKLKFDDYIWKHKWGGAGHRLLLSPTLADLDRLSHCLEDYIAQKKVRFKIFRTDDGKEKIVELRFMTATHEDKTIIVPMARIGHVVQSPSGGSKFKIHFGDNNKEGYGFSPVLIFNK